LFNDKKNLSVIDQDIDEKVKINSRSSSRNLSRNIPEIDNDNNDEKDWDEELPVIIKKRNTVSDSDNSAGFSTQIKQQKPATQYSPGNYTSPVNKSKKYSKIITFLVVFVCIATIALALSLLYTKALVTIVPSNIPVSVDGNFIAKKDSNTADVLGYQVVSINFDEYKTVPATDGPTVQTKSKGTITLYNNYGTTSQKILAGTKLANSKNQIYKTTWSVVIPGRKLDKGKIVPGSVDVGIVADQPGIEYDMSVLTDTAIDFTIPAFKNTPRYTTVTGRLKKDLVGGFNGKKKVISPEVEKVGYSDIESELKTKLLKNIKLAVPDDLVLFDDAYTIEYQKLPVTNIDSSTAKIGSKGTLYGIIFNTKTLLDNLARKQIDDNRLQTYKIDGLKSLKFTMINSKNNPIKSGSPISFNLNGSIKITGTFSESELKNKLLSVKLDQMNTVIKQYPSIKSVSVILTPFWMRRFPNSVDNIIFEYKQ
jgi:hypothetical protein